MTVTTWFERDRAMVLVEMNGIEVACWWDDEVYELVEDGFLDPRDWRGSAIAYATYLWGL